MRLGPLVLLLACGACSGDTRLFLTAQPDARSTLIAFVVGDDVGLTAESGAPVESVFEAPPEGASITVLFFQRTLAELSITPGPVRLFPPEQPSRELPAFDAAFTRPLDSGDWAALDALEEPLSKIRIAPFDEHACVAGGGCFDAIAAPGACVLPCPATPAPDLPLPPEAPEPAARPVLTPCPVGWATTPNAGQGPSEVCTPPASAPLVPCAEVDEAQRYGAASCTRIGSVCPSGDFADVLPAGPIVYVRPGATGGNGTIAAPYGSIAAAILATPAGAVLALAKGVHDGEWYVPSGFTLFGACVRDTVLTVTAPGAWSVRATGTGVVVKNLRISGSDGGALAAGGAELSLEDVIIEHTNGAGIDAFDSDVSATRVVLRDAGRVSGVSLSVRAGHAELEDVAIEDPPYNGVTIEGPDATVHGVSVRVRGPDQGPAVDILDRAGADFSGLRIAGHATALRVLGGSTATVSDVGVHGSVVAMDVPIYVAGRSSLVLRGAEISASAACALTVDTNSRVALTGALFHDVQSGVCSYGGAHQHVRKVELRDVVGSGISLTNGRGLIEDVWIARSDANAVIALDQAVLEARRLAITNSRAGIEVRGTAVLEDIRVDELVDHGLTFSGPSLRLWRLDARNIPLGTVVSSQDSEASLELTDVTTRAVRGLHATVAALRLERLRFEDAREGLNVTARTSTITDVAVLGAPFLFVLYLAPGADGMRLERIYAEDIAQHAISIHGPGHFVLEDIDLLRTLAALHVASDNNAFTSGGLAQVELARFRSDDAETEALTTVTNTELTASHLTILRGLRGVHTKGGLGFATTAALSRFLVRECSDAGLWHETIADTLGTEIELSDGVITGNGSGLRNDTMDRVRQLRRVSFHDNGVDLE